MHKNPNTPSVPTWREILKLTATKTKDDYVTKIRPKADATRFRLGHCLVKLGQKLQPKADWPSDRGTSATSPTHQTSVDSTAILAVREDNYAPISG